MKGIQFVIDDKGQKVAVQVDLKIHGGLWEDFYDSLVAQLRAEEPRESLESVKERLRRRSGPAGECSQTFVASHRGRRGDETRPAGT